MVGHVNFCSLVFACFVVLVSVSKPVEGEVRNIKYGDRIYLQNGYMDKRWLSGTRDGGNERVQATNLLSSNYEQTVTGETYRWTVRSTPGDGRTGSRDPKAGQCLKYGDIIYLQNNYMDNRWLSGSRGGGSLPGNEFVKTQDTVHNSYEASQRSTYKWKVRSSPGTGSLSDNGDPGNGVCVVENSLVYLQNMYMGLRWLSGSRGESGIGPNAGVLTRNIYLSSYEEVNVRSTYLWILRLSSGTGSRVDGVQCSSAATAKGSWVPLAYSNGASTITYKEGTTRSKEHSETQTQSWSESITHSISVGFEFKAVSASYSLEVSNEYGESQESSISSAVSKSEEVTIAQKFSAGQVWQFQYSAADICAGLFDIKTRDLVVTKGQYEPPCCLPGFFMEINEAHGACYGSSPCTCSAEICGTS